jgi:hypothetical protein
VLASTEELFGLYTAATGERPLHLHGTPDFLSPAELHRRAWPLVQPCFLQAERKATATYEQLLHTQPALAAATVREIVPAALVGRVKYLFVTPAPPLWGYVNPDSGHVSIHETGLPGDRDLVDLAVEAVLRHQHAVFPLRAEVLPAAGPMAAVLYG